MYGTKKKAQCIESNSNYAFTWRSCPPRR